MDIVNGLAGYGTGPRAGVALGVAFFIIGALLLRPVKEARRAGGEAAGSAGPAGGEEIDGAAAVSPGPLEGVADAHA
jgi:hypothetical protein